MTIFRFIHLVRMALLAAVVAIAATAKADPVGNLGMAALAPTTSDTGNVNTATAFTLGTWVSTFGEGTFAGLPTQFFGNVSFNTTIPTSLSFGSSAFGTFMSTSITVVTSPTNFLNLMVVGEWAPGTFGGVTGGPFPARLDLSFSQVGGPGTPISASGTFLTPPPAVIPEPPGLVLGLTGLVALALIYGRRRGRLHLAMTT